MVRSRSLLDRVGGKSKDINTANMDMILGSAEKHKPDKHKPDKSGKRTSDVHCKAL